MVGLDQNLNLKLGGPNQNSKWLKKMISKGRRPQNIKVIYLVFNIYQSLHLSKLKVQIIKSTYVPEYSTFSNSACFKYIVNKQMVTNRKNEYLPNFDWPGLPESFYKSAFLFNPVLYWRYSK